ncbi:factor H binding family protein [Neisseria sp. Dent CA1/247]|uniref:factor H binding family protein n=1 Tax=Neisseria sp. Dent CA1/247 TaxID=2912675 RepID=UPI001FD544A9|nr:factor H binding family protein [Neisseria sp. Dent CA1/247]UOO77026.1 factor H binding family protein [Neisseria sp. Dent CA1/247]
MKTFNTLVLASAASLALSACGAINDALDSIQPSERNGHYHAIVTPDLSSTNTQKNVTLKLGGKEYRAGNEIDIVKLPQNTVIDQNFEKTGEVVKDGRAVQFKEAGTARIYKNNYSVVLAAHVENVTGADTDSKGSTKVLAVQGIANDLETVKAQKGSFLYAGRAFTGKNEQGSLTYHVDFDKNVGSGSITGIASTGTINLKESRIEAFTPNNGFMAKAGIKGEAVAEKDKVVGSYQLGFFGKKGNETDEIAGKANFLIDGKAADIGFGGRKQPNARK